MSVMNEPADKVYHSFAVNHDDDYVQQYADYYVHKQPWRAELENSQKGILYSSVAEFGCGHKAWRQTEFCRG
jgi:hypothetical protein